MTLPTTRRLLWLAAVLLVPLPMLQFDAFVPAIRYLLLAGVTLGLIVSEGGGEIPYLLLGLMLGHAVVYAGAFWWLSGVAARALWAATPRRAGRIVLGVSLAGLVLALVTEPYVTPYSGISLHSNLWVVLQ